MTLAGFTANWAPLSGALGYRLDVSTDPNFGSYILHNSDMGTNTAFRLASLKGGGYYYRVRGVAGNLTSANSAVMAAIDAFPGLVWIPPGQFLMGSPVSEQGREFNEGPQTLVTLTRGYWMSQYEATQEEYQSVIGSNPSGYTGDPQRPVDSVKWYDAVNYCAQLTAREQAAGRLPEGYGYRLPTEAEWEYACRAGTTTQFSYGDDADYARLKDYAWVADNSDNQTHPVGRKRPNGWGLYDMYGNVREWCQDWYFGYPGGSVVDPQRSGMGSLDRIDRGGFWSDSGGNCRSAAQGRCHASLGFYTHGFRPVLAPGQ